MDDKLFEKLVSEAIDSLPKIFAEKLENVAVTIEDEPTPLQMRKMNLPPWALLFGLYQGVPQTNRGIYYSAPPDKITIFKNPILRVSNSPSEIKAKVREVVIHEIGHHFGLSDNQMK